MAPKGGLAQLCLVESVVVGEPLIMLHQRSADRLTALLEPGRGGRDIDPERAAAVAEGLIGGF